MKTTNRITASENTQSPPTIEKTSLSFTKEVLYVALIWLFIIGVPLTFCYNIFFFPLVWAGQAFLEYWLRTKYNIAFLPRRFLNWLYATHAWDILVLRTKTNPKTTSLRRWARACFLIGIGILYIAHINSSLAINLNEMSVTTGTLEGWERHTGRYTCGDTLTIRLQDGSKQHYVAFINKTSENYYKKISGENITVWAQNEPNHLNPKCRNIKYIKQIKHDGHIIGRAYNKKRIKNTSIILTKTGTALIIIGIVCYLRIWSTNRNAKNKIPLT